MNKRLWCMFILLPCLCYGASGTNDQCTTARVLTKIRPGAAWVMQADSMRNLKWLDTKQKKPSVTEVEKARQACLTETKARDAQKIQARLDVKNPTIPVEKKVEQLILLLDLDK